MAAHLGIIGSLTPTRETPTVTWPAGACGHWWKAQLSPSGPLIVALILGRVGHIRRQVWHMPVNRNLAFREFRIALFFATFGLGAGAKFFAIVFSATGVQWLLAGACVTVLSPVIVGIFARVVLKMNFMALSGLLAGSMTDPPALAFASNIAYGTVYPLTTLLRILSAQVLALVLFR